jgi:hypothetical protein
MSMSLPSDLALPFEVVQLSRQFITGRCQDGSWCPDGTRPVFTPSQEANQWLINVHDSAELVKHGLFQHAFKYLDLTFDHLTRLLHDPDPTLFVYIYCMLAELPENISQRLSQYAAEMAAIILPANHPMNLILTKLSKADSRQLLDHGLTILSSYFYILQEYFDKQEIAMLGFTKLFYKLLFLTKLIDYDTEQSKQREIAGNIQSLHHCTTEVLHTELALAESLSKNGQYEAAMTVLREVEEAMRRDDGSVKRSVVSRYLSIYDYIQKATGITSDAVDTARRCMQVYVKNHGFDNPKTICFISNLQTYFEGIGEVDEAYRLGHTLDSGEEFEQELQAYFGDVGPVAVYENSEGIISSKH